MSKKITYADKAPQPPASYSQAVKAGGFVFVAGQGPFDPATGEVVGETIQAHTRQCLKNSDALLTAADSSLEKVVSAPLFSPMSVTSREGLLLSRSRSQLILRGESRLSSGVIWRAGGTTRGRRWRSRAGWRRSPCHARADSGELASAHRGYRAW
jgi:endoribonuclease L-PSP